MGKPKPTEPEQPVPTVNGPDPKPPEAGQLVPTAGKWKNCFDCGFLTIKEGEASPAERLKLLLAEVVDWQAHSPQCFRKQWIDYDMSPWANPSKELLHELSKSRDKCPYSIGYLPGLSPAQHLDRWSEEDSFAKNEPPPAPREPSDHPSPALQNAAVDSDDASKSAPESDLVQQCQSRKGDAMLLADKQTVDFKTAEAYLGIKERQRQDLVQHNKLEVIGEGRGSDKQITTESLRKYLPPKSLSNPQ